MKNATQEIMGETVDATRKAWRSEVLLLAVQHFLAVSVAKTSIKRGIFRFNHKSEKPDNIQIGRSILTATGLFDRTYYLAENTDVAASGQEPIDHYLIHGGIEGRRPGPLFDGYEYLQSYGDVKAAGLNPVLHYIVYGIPEGRTAGTPTTMPQLSNSIMNEIIDARATSVGSKTLKDLSQLENIVSVFDLLQLSHIGYTDLTHSLLNSLSSITQKIDNNGSQKEIADLRLEKATLQSLLHRSTAKNDELLLELRTSRKEAIGRVREVQADYEAKNEAQRKATDQTNLSLKYALENLFVMTNKSNAVIKTEESTRLAGNQSHVIQEENTQDVRLIKIVEDIQRNLNRKESGYEIPTQAIDFIRLAQSEERAEADKILFLLQRLTFKLFLSLQTVQEHNLDRGYTPFSELTDAVGKRHRFITFSSYVVANWDRLAGAYHLLANDRSKDLFLNLLLFRALGHEYVRLSSNTDEFWEHRRWTSNLKALPSDYASTDGGTGINLYTIESDGRRIELECFENNIFFTFGVKQYYYSNEGCQITPVRGDYVVDAGTCFGDTAIKMALSVGDMGRVFSFDPVSIHRSIAKQNIERNNIKNILIMPFGLSHTCCIGSSSSSIIDPGFKTSNDINDFPLRTIDSLIEDGTIEKINFIKMDIEGSELSALRGATIAIGQFKPKLAISLYHKWSDYFTIIEFIESLSLGYKFYLENYTLSDEETVLYCSVD